MKRQMLFMALLLSFGLNLAAASAEEGQEVQRCRLVRVLSGELIGQAGVVDENSTSDSQSVLVTFGEQMGEFRIFFKVFIDRSNLEYLQG